ncbi:ER degradation-enhancing alpha-mannosidase-like protein 1 [[Candida] jaroonii]|uniref:ER degradation-enhancing alpha-mannosidase-like protein 1 n=1 Tax=[Candida] jaroonii TaxID=467808 RepID=A0ACA9YGA8_9ASCO|nr:ER degradation-enhancing alpha-mannosidase-like protein 1 [[Candida] jaroonii]
MNLLWIWLVSIVVGFNSSFTPDHLRYLKDETKLLFDHAWNSYMEFGFPFDEVTPMSCQPYGPDFKDKNNIVRNDVMGNVSSTLLDNLDSLIIMEKWQDLERSLDYLKGEKSTFFNKNVIIQVFEMTIRSLGGLLSTHTILSDSSIIKNEEFQRISENYDGFLLEMANDLGLRLLPAFKTSTGIPVPRINLSKGVKSVPYKLQMETCTSGVTTPVLEFTLLSRLTGNPDFEYYTKKTFEKVWAARSDLDLLPMTLSPIDGEWKDAISGIGASIDSFYEYALKSSIVFNDNHMWNIFKKSYKALMTHSVKGSIEDMNYMMFANVGVNDGLDATVWIDSLSAFWTGVQVLSGRLKDAIGSHMTFMKLWDHFDSIPERWNCLIPKDKLGSNELIGLEWYPLRPEFIESTYYLYRATRDPMYLNIGERILNLFKTRFKSECGFKGIQNIRTGEFQDRMESFVLSETLKYLYLLFDEQEEVFLHSKDMTRKNWIFSTEGHPLWYDYSNSTQYIEPDVHSHFEQELEKCELNPFTRGPKDFLKSNYYDMNLFKFDYDYQDYLKRPQYLENDGYMELNNDFFNKFTLFDTELMSPVSSTTSKFELFLGNSSGISNSTIIKEGSFYYIEDFRDLRLSLEFLGEGKVDTSYNLVTKEMIRQINKPISQEMIVHDIVGRVLKVNGVFIKPNERIFINRFELGKNNLGILNSKLLINGFLIENIDII